RHVAVSLAGLLLVGVLAAPLVPWLLPARDDAPGRASPVSLDLRREDIPPALLTLAGGGDPAQAPPELAAVLGDEWFLLPRFGGTSWMDQGPDGKLLAVPLEEDVALFDAATGRFRRTLKGPGGGVVAVTFSGDSGLLAASTWHQGAGGAVRVWDLAAGQELFTGAIPGPKISCAAAFSPDSKYLVTEAWPGLQVWEARSGRKVQSVALEPDGVG